MGVCSLTCGSRRWLRACELVRLGVVVERGKLTCRVHRLQNHPVHLDPPSLMAFRHAFSETDKLAYLGAPDDGASIAPPSFDQRF